MASDKDDKATVLRSNGNLQIDYALKWLPDLHLNLNLGYDVSKSKENIYLTANSPTAWDSYHNDGAGAYQHIEQFKSNTLLDFYINYKKDVEKIMSNFDVTAGYSWQRFYRDGWNNGTEFTTNGFSSPVLNADGTYTLAEGTQRIGTTWTNPETTKWASHLQLLSFFGRLNYTFFGRYLLTATVRGDASSRFHKDNRWGVFPSVALGWKITDEPWMKGVKDVMNEWKLRLGWGVTGQQDLNDDYYPYLATYIQSVQGSHYPWGSTTNFITTLYPGAYDPNIKWEETTTWNAGFDFAFLNNRITASVDYYFRKTKDLLSYVTVPIGSTTSNISVLSRIRALSSPSQHVRWLRKTSHGPSTTTWPTTRTRSPSSTATAPTSPQVASRPVRVVLARFMQWAIPPTPSSCLSRSTMPMASRLRVSTSTRTATARSTTTTAASATARTRR